MGTFDYLSVLLSIMVGLGFSRMLASLGELVLQRDRVRFYWVALLTAGIVFLAHVEFWWSAFGFRDIPEWNFFSFLLLLLVSIALYLLSVLVLPDPSGEDALDLRDYFFRNHRWFYSTATLYLLLDVSFDLFVGRESLLQPVRFFQVGFAVMLVTAAITRNERFHQVVAVLAFALFLTQIALLGLEIG